ncbi:hypothetical protein BV20DRAFT_414168 [Pilatotrama ljubarskyi]|nr:hypothetical protein BV20DRAFT_414168 [Pilatotrama ljubarskyi]
MSHLWLWPQSRRMGACRSKHQKYRSDWNQNQGSLALTSTVVLLRCHPSRDTPDHPPISLTTSQHTMMTGTSAGSALATPRMEVDALRDFFDRLATGDYHALAKELNIPKPATRPPPQPTPLPSVIGPDGEISFDSFDSFTFEPTVEGLERAVSLICPSSPTKQQTPEEEEAFQFTFRLMVHKLYTIHDFAKMVDDVVRTSQERFQPLPAELTSRRASFSYAYAYPGDNESFMSAGTLGSSSETTLPSSPSLWSVDRFSELEKELDGDMRALKKRRLGRRLSVVDTEGTTNKPEDRAWVYDSAVASMESPISSSSYATFLEGLPPMSPAGESPSRYGYAGGSDEADYGSRKRRFSLLAARGF